ncbi:Imm26 family immunity protein [Caballeronia calidae]|uniref:Imm26 family immunity protein n=1 Tax=Caballeronia calidae TaxID=1777139 RepID=UPI0007881EDD|nr:Imm26 family immunity protein [Caballeronia calidae]
MKFDKFSWDKKKSTKLRFIRAGDIFCFHLDEGVFGFGRIMGKISMGHVGEIFDYFSDEPCFEDDLPKRLFPPIILDSYALFDRKTSGDWRIVAHQNDFVVDEVGEIFFRSVDGKKVDFFDQVVGDARHGESLIPYSSMRDGLIKKYIEKYKK